MPVDFVAKSDSGSVAGLVPEPGSLWLANTDADSVVPWNWLIHQVDLADAGADLVLGNHGGLGRHLAGIGVGGMVAQIAALDHPGAFSALTLAGTRAVAPGKPDADLPDHDKAAMKRLFTRPMPDWTDREAVAEFAAAGAEILGDDPVAARAIAARIWDRTPGTAPRSRWPTSSAWSSPSSTANPAGASACPRSRSPCSSFTAAATRSSPSVTGRRPREVPGARLLVLEEAATAIPDAPAGQVAEAMLALG